MKPRSVKANSRAGQIFTGTGLRGWDQDVDNFLLRLGYLPAKRACIAEEDWWRARLETASTKARDLRVCSSDLIHSQENDMSRIMLWFRALLIAACSALPVLTAKPGASSFR
jgi:hypothetical protein